MSFISGNKHMCSTYRYHCLICRSCMNKSVDSCLIYLQCGSTTQLNLHHQTYLDWIICKKTNVDLFLRVLAICSFLNILKKLILFQNLKHHKYSCQNSPHTTGFCKQNKYTCIPINTVVQITIH